MEKIELRPEEEAEYQNTANAVSNTVYNLMHQMHVMNAATHGISPEEGNGGPIVQGVIGALISFMMDGPNPDDVIRDNIVESVEYLIPQMRMSATLGRMGGSNEEGHA